MAKAVDRLKLVADHEQPRLGSDELLDQGHLQPVGVLKLVDEDVLEASPPEPLRGLAGAQKRQRPQLQVLEVEPGALGLERRVAAGEGREQLANGLVGIAAGFQHRGEPGLGDRLAPQPVVGGQHEPPQPADLQARRDQGRDLTFERQLLEGVVEGALGQVPSLGRVEYPKARVQPGGQRHRGEQPAAEGMDGRDPGSLRVPRPQGQLRGSLVVAPFLGQRRAAHQLGADPGTQLSGGALGEGEGEDRFGADAVLGDRVAVAADKHGRLAGAGARLEEDVAVAGGDGTCLLRRWIGRTRLHVASSSSASSGRTARSWRQIGW